MLLPEEAHNTLNHHASNRIEIKETVRFERENKSQNKNTFTLMAADIFDFYRSSQYISPKKSCQ